jgi:acetoin utilization protein AcuB
MPPSRADREGLAREKGSPVSSKACARKRCTRARFVRPRAHERTRFFFSAVGSLLAVITMQHVRVGPCLSHRTFAFERGDTEMETPRIRDIMTPAPHTIGVDQSLFRAREMMREHHVRHLPVLRAGRLVGIVTERDVALVEALEELDEREVLVEEAMTSDVYAVRPDQALDVVVDHMAKHKLGSAIVAEGDRVLGVFTSVDALRLLALELRGEFAA